MRLRKSLYGTPHAPANWHGTIVDFVITTGLKPLKSDPCLYIYNPTTKNGPTFATRNKGMVILTMHVDNRLPLGQNKVLLKQLGEKLVRRFGTMCMGDVFVVLGKQVIRNYKGRSPSHKRTTPSRCARCTAWASANRCTRS